jgi:hypothetical protein
VEDASPALGTTRYNPWANFYAKIKQDDKEKDIKSRQERDREGETFRPELKETYQDRKGKKEVALHEKIVSKAEVKAEREVHDKVADTDMSSKEKWGDVKAGVVKIAYKATVATDLANCENFSSTTMVRKLESGGNEFGGGVQIETEEPCLVVEQQ